MVEMEIPSPNCPVCGQMMDLVAREYRTLIPEVIAVAEHFGVTREAIVQFACTKNPKHGSIWAICYPDRSCFWMD